MATVIRLKRGGRTHAPYYRVVVMDSRNRTRGRVLEEIGIYHPCARPVPQVEVDGRRALEWMRKGAQVSDTVRAILKKQGVIEAFASGVKPEDLAEPEAVQADAAPASEPEQPAPAESEPVQADAAPAAEPEAKQPAPAESEAETAPDAEE